VSDKSAAALYAPPLARNTQPSADGESGQRSFMHDQLEALLASPTLARVAQRHSDDEDETFEPDEAEIDDREAEPSIDAQVLRDALRAGLDK